MGGVKSNFRGLREGFVNSPISNILTKILSRFDVEYEDYLYLGVATSYFNDGMYDRAMHYYKKIGPGEHSIKARQMIDWIDFKFGIVDRGWPAYPGAYFNPEQEKTLSSSPPAPIFVDNPSKPHEAVNGLKLTQWKEASSDDLPILVWLNFRSSLGGELLACKVVKTFQQKFGLQLILAVDPRLHKIASINFPGTLVIAKDEDMSTLRGKCRQYILARDTLKYMVSSEEDFSAIAAQIIELSTEPSLPADTRTRPRVAISWKTTNRRQGLYRNIPLVQFAKFLANFDLEYCSAQHGITPNEKETLTKHLGERIRFDMINPDGTVHEIALQLNQMDAVITIDNSVMHIASAIDVVTFGLLSVPSYWAWPIKGSGGRWYRSLKLIHQRVPRQWDDVLKQLDTGLDEFTAAREK
ncbi:MAG: glycosyltransferase family 9 protein [Bacteroidetes bacterium]|nr:glycosyltransferase family 9 protein [Bacteroidota bacterium]